MTFNCAKGIAGPGVAAVTATGIDLGAAAFSGVQDHRATGTTAAGGVIAHIVAGAAADIDDSAAVDTARAQDDDAATGTTGRTDAVAESGTAGATA